MRFILVNRFFRPDESATSLLLTDLAEDLAARKHEVDVITSRQLYHNPRANLPAFEVWQGIRIHRLFSTAFGRNTLIGRLLDIATFRRSFLSGKRRLSGPDVWFVMTDPPLILGAALQLRRKLGGRIVHQVNDVYPDLADVLGTLPVNGMVRAWLYRQANQSLLQCDHILALGECMAQVLRKKGIPEERISIMPPWADGEKLWSVPHHENSFRKELGLSESDFIVMYSGNMGRGHRFETILEGAKALAHENRILFVFIGDGTKRDEINAFRKRHRLETIHLLPYQPCARLRETLSAGNVHLISLDSRVQGLMVPSKLAGVLAAERPVIFVGDHENSVAQAILRAECGFVVEEGNSERLENLILQLSRDDEYCRSLGRRGRLLFEREYDRRVVVPRIIPMLENRRFFQFSQAGEHA